MSEWAAIARFGGIGDNLIASAVLPGLKAKYDRVEVITQCPQHVVFENNPYIDKLSVYSPGDIPGGDSEAWQGWFSTRAKEYSFFANLSHSCETMRVLVKGQTQFYWSSAFRRKFCGQSYLETVADICDVPYTTLAPGFFPTDDEHERAVSDVAKIGQNVVGWVLSGTRIDKIYPYAPMAIARLIRDVGPVILFGSPSQKEVEMAKAIQSYLLTENGSVDGLGIAMSPTTDNEIWPIRRLLSTVQACDLVITPDTGPAWAAAMCDVPKVVLLSHASPENITKYWRNTVTLHADVARVDCWPCHQLHDTAESCRANRDGNGAACISDITVDRILVAATAALERKDACERSGEATGTVPVSIVAARRRNGRDQSPRPAHNGSRTSQPASGHRA